MGNSMYIGSNPESNDMNSEIQRVLDGMKDVSKDDTDREIPKEFNH